MTERERKVDTYSSSGLVVVQIHFLSQIAATFTGIDEFAGEFEAETNVVRTTTPFPVAYTSYAAGLGIGLRRTGLMAVVTGARFYGTLTAGSGNRMSNSSTSNGINEASFTASWKIEKKKN